MKIRDLKILVAAVKTGTMPMFFKYGKMIPADEWLDILEKRQDKKETK